MKAIVIHGPKDIRYDDVDIKPLKPDEVLVKIKSVGLCGTDYELYTNEMIYIADGLCKLPMVPGHEWAGIIEAVGTDVTNFQIGDKVTGECTVSCGKCHYCRKGMANMCINRTETGVLNRDGGFAEYISFPTSALHKFNTLSFDEASLIEPTAIALYSVMRAKIVPFDNVLVIGPGPIGLQAAQIVKKVFGAKKIILSGTRDERLDRAKVYGLDGYINIRKENLFDRVNEITNGQMIDAVIVASGGSGVFQDIKSVINPGGKISLVGFFGSTKVECDWDSVSTKDLSIYGSLGSPGVWDYVIELLEEGKLDTKNLISHVMDLKSAENFKTAMNIMVDRKENVCKVIMHP